MSLTPPVEIGKVILNYPRSGNKDETMESRLRVKVVYEGEVLYTDMLTRKQMEKLVAAMKRKGYDLEVTRLED